MTTRLNIVTLNIHKGMSAFNTHFMLDKQRAFLRALNPDLVFLQEVRGLHPYRKHQVTNHQYEYLADQIWPHFAYGQNVASATGHGNVILSKFPIVTWQNKNISAHTIEGRGLLHCQIAIPGLAHEVHCMCVHFGLFEHWRRYHLQHLNEHIKHHVPAESALIIAGDFNDWRQNASQQLAQQMHLKEVFRSHHGQYAKSFPALLPLFRLDRIYVRGFDVIHCEVTGRSASTKVSDHSALFATLQSL